MNNKFEQASIQLLPEFSQEVPDSVEINKIVSSYKKNRDTIYQRAEEFGLSQDTIGTDDSSSVIVGPFVYPTPLATTFAGEPNNLRTAVAIGQQIANGANTSGYSAEQFSTVILTLSNPAQMNKDCIVLPKNATENQRIRLFSKSEDRKAYGFVQILESDFQRTRKAITDSFNQYKDRTPLLKTVGKNKGREIVDAAVNDFDTAWKARTTDKYVDFADQYNALLTQRAIPGCTLPSTAIDSTVYTDFLKSIDNPARFYSLLIDAGVIEFGSNIVKIVNERQMTEMLQLERIISGAVILRSSISGIQMEYSDLTQLDISLAPTKEISYILCFANVIPVIYGDINNDSYYAPYAIAKNRVQTLGFEPVMYRIQPLVYNDVREYPTLFDYYTKIILEE